MVREGDADNLEDSVAGSGPDPWPRGDSSPEQVNRLVQQEMSHLKALKRLSIGSAFASPGDPDLPDFDSEAEFDMDAHGDSGAFVRQASLQKQRSVRRERSIRRERSVPTTRRERQKRTAPFIVDASPAPGAQASQPHVEPGFDNIWVPAGVHPELAPNEWRTFVTDKLAEIRNSQEQQQQSRGPRHQSRLSHEVADLEEYVDASAILDKRRRSASSGEKRRSILDLSREFATEDATSGLHETPARRNSEHDDSDVNAQFADAFQPPDLRPIGGATSLRRSTHRMRRPSPRTPSRSEAAAEQAPASTPAPHEQPSSSAHSHKPSQQQGLNFSPSAHAASSAAHTRQRSRSRMLGRPPLSVSISAAKAVATTAEQPPSPSAATPSPTASTMLRYRRHKLDSESRTAKKGSQLRVSSSELPQDVPERDPSRPPLSSVISPRPSPVDTRAPVDTRSPPSSSSPSESDSDIENLGPAVSVQYDIVDPAGSMKARDINWRASPRIEDHPDIPVKSRTDSPVERTTDVAATQTARAFTSPDTFAAAKKDARAETAYDAKLSTDTNLDTNTDTNMDANIDVSRDTSRDASKDVSRDASRVVRDTWRDHHRDHERDTRLETTKIDTKAGTSAGADAENKAGDTVMTDTDAVGESRPAGAVQPETLDSKLVAAGSPVSPDSAKTRPDKNERRWRWLDSSNSGTKDPESVKEPKSSRPLEGLTLSNFFKKRDSKRDAKREREREKVREREREQHELEKQKQHEKQQEQEQEQARQRQRQRERELPATPTSADSAIDAAAGQSADYASAPAGDATQTSPDLDASKAKTPRRPRGHMRADSRTSNRLAKEGDGGDSNAPRTVRARGRRKTEYIERSGQQERQEISVNMAQPEIKLPYDIPAHQISDRSYVMMYHRFPLHIERAIYRLSHMKLANPRRPLRQQVLLSNFMYAYLNLINYGYQQQQLQQYYEQQQQNGFGGHLEAEQLEQLKRIETKNYDEAMYTSPATGDMESSSSSDDEAEMEVDEGGEVDGEATYLFKTA